MTVSAVPTEKLAAPPQTASEDPFSGLRVAITGGTSGLGLALVRELLSRGARVAFVARTPERVEQVVRENPGAHGSSAMSPLRTTSIRWRFKSPVSWAVSTCLSTMLPALDQRRSECFPTPSVKTSTCLRDQCVWSIPAD